jgi:hypothetical protein
MPMAIEQLIADYLQQAEKCLSLFAGKFGRRDLVRAWREHVVPQAGELAKGVDYHMHGVGCAVEFPDYEVDFDFASSSQVGFDVWRLWRFAKQFPERYPEYQEEAAIENAVNECIVAGTITRAATDYPGEANERLFILASE